MGHCFYESNQWRNHGVNLRFRTGFSCSRTGGKQPNYKVYANPPRYLAYKDQHLTSRYEAIRRTAGTIEQSDPTASGVVKI